MYAASIAMKSQNLTFLMAPNIEVVKKGFYFLLKFLEI